MSKKLIYFALIAFILASWSPVLVEAARTGVAAYGGYFTTNGDALNTVYYNSGPVDVGSSASGAAALYVQGYSGSASSTFAVASSTGLVHFSISSNGTTTIKQYQGFGTPTVSTSTGAGASAGTATLTTGSTDLAGQISLATGASPAVNAKIIEWKAASSTAPIFCIYSAANATSSWLGVASSTYMTASTTAAAFTLTSGSIGLIANTTYVWNYHCN